MFNVKKKPKFITKLGFYQETIFNTNIKKDFRELAKKHKLSK